MAGEWIKLETSLPSKAEIIRLARLLSVKRDEAVGIAVRFWIWADSNTVDGVVDGVASTDVDAVLSTPGLCKALEMVGWLAIDKENERIQIPKFERHNGESAKKRALKNERQARWRDASVDALVDVKASTREEKRREEKNKEPLLASSAPALSPVNGNAVCYIPLNDGSEFGVSAEQVSEFEKLYPAVDVPQTLNEIRGWNLANPSRRKTKRGVLSHINGWLSKEQNRGPAR